jgi:transcriptional regulator with XRE-family HTH domain
MLLGLEVNLVRRTTRRRAPVSVGGPDPIDIEVGANLRQSRLARGFSQTELGDALGISFQQVQKYERGVNRVSASMLVRAARFLTVAPSQLLPPEDATTESGLFTREFARTRGAIELVEAFASLEEPDLRRAILQFVRVMAQKAGGRVRGAFAEPEPHSR